MQYLRIGPDTVGDHEPSRFGFDRRAAVPDLHILPTFQRTSQQLGSLQKCGLSE
jgi:hypothetical protein